MPVEDVFTITGRGTVATGRVERGVLHLNDEVEIVGIKEETRKTVVTGIEMFRKLLDEAQAGDNIGALLRGVQRTEIERGQCSVLSPVLLHCHTQIYRSGLRSDQGRGRPSYTFLQQLSVLSSTSEQLTLPAFASCRLVQRCACLAIT